MDVEQLTMEPTELMPKAIDDHDPFEFLGPNWKNTPLSTPLFRGLLKFMAKHDFNSNENKAVVEGIASGFGLSAEGLRICLNALERVDQ